MKAPSEILFPSPKIKKSKTRRKEGIRLWCRKHIHDMRQQIDEGIKTDTPGTDLSDIEEKKEVIQIYTKCLFRLEKTPTLSGLIKCLEEFNENLTALGWNEDSYSNDLIEMIHSWADSRGHHELKDIPEKSWPRLKVLERWKGRWDYDKKDFTWLERTDYKILKICNRP